MKKPSVDTEQQLSIKLYPNPFAGTCLPLTMEFAQIAFSLLRPHMAKDTAKWPVSDRVLHWLLPNLREDMRKFYSGKGPALATMFNPYSLQKLDKQLLAQLLERIKMINPAAAAIIQKSAITSKISVKED